MTESDYLGMLDEVDRLLSDPVHASWLLSDPAVLVDPARLWSLLADIFDHPNLLAEEIGSDGVKLHRQAGTSLARVPPSSSDARISARSVRVNNSLISTRR